MRVTVDAYLGTAGGLALLAGVRDGKRVIACADARMAWPIIEALELGDVVPVVAEEWQLIVTADPRPIMAEVARDIARARRMAAFRAEWSD